MYLDCAKRRVADSRKSQVKMFGINKLGDGDGIVIGLASPVKYELSDEEEQQGRANSEDGHGEPEPVLVLGGSDAPEAGHAKRRGSPGLLTSSEAHAGAVRDDGMPQRHVLRQ